MVKFAKSCMEKLDLILNDLEISLGSDTMQLGMRVGIHSGSVTAGVLRGDKSRFQLFGDTVNTGTICKIGSDSFVYTAPSLILAHHRQNGLLLTLFEISTELFIGCSQLSASRMESNGMKGRIHCSQETADELIMAGKTSWIKTREDRIIAKGKGEMQTYVRTLAKHFRCVCLVLNCHSKSL